MQNRLKYWNTVFSLRNNLEYVIKGVLVFMTLVLVRTTANAQSTVIIEIDTVTNQAKAAIPFDIPFALKINGSKAKKINKAILIKSHVENGLVYMDGDPKIIGAANVQTNQAGALLYFEPLMPNQEFILMIGYKFDGSKLRELMTINQLISKNLDNSAKDKFITLQESLEDRLDQGVSGLIVENASIPITMFEFNSYEDYQCFYIRKLKDQYDSLIDMNAFTASTVITEAMVDTTRNSSVALSVGKDELNKLYYAIHHDILSDITAGLSSFDNPNQNIGVYDFSQRTANLKNSSEYVEKQRTYITDIYLITKKEEALALLTSLDDLAQELDANYKLVKRNSKKIQDSIAKERKISSQSWATGSSTLLSLKSRGSYYLIPELGVTNIVSRRLGRTTYIPRPFLGVNIYLRAVNKDIPFNYTKKNFKRRFAINVGLTLGDIDKNGLSDFFNNMSLLAGCSYKVTREISISTGLVLMQAQNSNPGIERLQVAPGWHLGIGIDLDFSNAISKLTGKIY